MEKEMNAAVAAAVAAAAAATAAAAAMVAEGEWAFEPVLATTKVAGLMHRLASTKVEEAAEEGVVAAAAVAAARAALETAFRAVSRAEGEAREAEWSASDAWASAAAEE